MSRVGLASEGLDWVLKRTPSLGKAPELRPAIAGCYLTANLPEIGPGPLFVDDFFKKVGTTQGFVAWTDAAFVADARHRRLTKAGYVFIAVVVVGVLALAGFVGLAPKQPK